jgi:hypothetical protein
MPAHVFSRRATLVSLLVLAVGAADARPAPNAPITIRQAWTRPTPAGMNAAGYLTIINASPFPDRLTSAASPAAAKVSLHQSRQQGGVMIMLAVPAVRAPARGQVNFAPGGYHLMLEHLARPLRLGQRVPVTLTFDRAGPVGAQLEVGNAAPAK